MPGELFWMLLSFFFMIDQKGTEKTQPTREKQQHEEKQNRTQHVEKIKNGKRKQKNVGFENVDVRPGGLCHTACVAERWQAYHSVILQTATL